ncbi:SDR family oxidoreductase [Planctomycetota bacterium]
MKHVFITGATGVIGSRLVPLYGADPDTQVTCLIRARSQVKTDKRLEDLRTFWGDNKLNGSIKGIKGDITEPFLGISRKEYNCLADSVTHIVHCAGNVRFNQSLEEARKNAVTSTGNILDLADICMNRGNLQKVETVSTLGVAGRTEGLVEEKAVLQKKDFRNTYEASKWEAEHLMYRALDRGVPLTIHRPSMVVGDSENGKVIRFQVFYYVCELLSRIRLLRTVKSFTFDIIPVDYVARALYLSSCSDDTAGSIFHHCSGPEQSLSFMGLEEKVSEYFSRRSVKLPLFLSRHILPKVSFLFPRNIRIMLKNLPCFLKYLEGKQLFSNCRSTQYFPEKGLTLPNIQNYIDKVMEYYISRVYS